MEDYEKEMKKLFINFAISVDEAELYCPNKWKLLNRKIKKLFLSDDARELEKLEAERDALRAELEQIKNPWISVQDRLPLTSGEIKQVMVLTTDGFDVEQCQFDAGTNWAEWNLYNNMESEHIKKWMPLPKPEGEGL